MNTIPFLVATALTVYGIETVNDVLHYEYNTIFSCNSPYRLRYWNSCLFLDLYNLSLSCNSPYRLRYWNWNKVNEPRANYRCCNSTYRLRYWNTNWWERRMIWSSALLQQYLSFTVLKPCCHAIDTIICLSCNSAYRSRYWNHDNILRINIINKLQQCLPFTVYAEGCEAAEEQSDDEVRTSQVPERSEGKTKVIK